ncbi:hypothetical protein Tco_1312559 [Tanacetum coccineum]
MKVDPHGFEGIFKDGDGGGRDVFGVVVDCGVMGKSADMTTLYPRHHTTGRTGNSSKSEGKKGSSIEDIDEIEAALAQLKRESGLKGD